MNQEQRRMGMLAMVALAAFAGAARAETAIRFDSVAPKTAGNPVSLLQSLREATKDMDLPAVVATKEVQPSKAAPLPAGVKAVPAFWGADGQWCRDGGVYRGGPCDNTGHWQGGDRDPWARDPSREGWGRGRSPYDDPWNDPYHGDPYRRGPYRRDPDERGPYRRDPYGRDPYRGPYREPYPRGPRRR